VIRANEGFFVDRMPSPLGMIMLVVDGDGVLRALDFEDHEARMQQLLQRHYGAGGLTSKRAPARVTDALAAYFAGDLGAVEDLAVRANGTEFQTRVWSALRRIPVGMTWSYGQLAAAVGNPKGSRAVGLANGANPIGIVVPCHRVIGANGTLTGYGGGIERKRWLLAHEQRWSE